MAKRWKETLDTLLWGLRLAFRIDRRSLLLWLGFSALPSVLPALALVYHRAILGGLSNFLLSGLDTHAQVAASILFYGALLTAAGLSSRFSDDMLYMMMYDAYYLGLEEAMMDSAQRLPLRELMGKKAGSDYFAAISRCGALTDVVSSGCVLVGRLVSILSLLAVAAGASWPTALMAAAYVALVLWLNARLSKRTQVVWSQLRDDMRRADYLEKLVREPDPAKEARLYGNLAQTIAQWRAAYQRVEDRLLGQAKGTALLAAALRAGFYVFLLLVMLLSILRLARGEMALDLALMLFALCISLSDAIGAFPKSYQRVAYGLYGLGIQRAFFENAPTAPLAGGDWDQAAEDQPVFEAKDVSFSYREGGNALSNLSFQIRKGESIALVGANGSGKTTLIKLLLGLYAPTQGELTCLGQSYTPQRCQALSEKIGAFFQDYYLFHLTVGENVGAGDVKNIENRALIQKALEEGGAQEVVSRLPKGLNNLLGVQVYKDGAVLSGGESQRVAVSRAFMNDKEILVFDEPASMLDPLAELRQFESIRAKVKTHTSILVSHRIGFARLADRIFVLDQGRLVEVGGHEELLQKNGVYAKLFHEQAQWYRKEEARA